MCGIVGFIDKKLEKSVLEAMMEKIIHRGPDGSGMYLDNTIALGHRRLAIIDIEGGSQPMKSQDGRLVCVFNGEIYNHKELRTELEKCGHDFLTESDTEVLLHGYEEWRHNLPCKLRGMFAFAIWDRQHKELFCVRDCFGIKPFYYYKKKEVFLFSSEIKSFLAHPNFEKKLNHSQLELYLTYQYSPGEQTFFEDVYKLPPAHFMVLKENQIKVVRYWKATFLTKSVERCSKDSSKFSASRMKQREDGKILENIDSLIRKNAEMRDANNEKSLVEWEMDISNVMRNSIYAHQISDVEVGSFLSSGVDSSYITSLSRVEKTFTVGFENTDYDEAEDAHAFSRSIGVWNKVYRITSDEFWEHLPKIQYHMDEPLADASSIALYFLNREAAKHVKVCLSGEGADELFAGYHIYKEPFMWAWYDRIPLILRQAIGAVAQCLPSGRGLNFLVRHSKNLSERYIGNTLLFTESQKKRILKTYSGKQKPIDIVRTLFQREMEMDSVAGKQLKEMEIDAVTYMQQIDIHLWLVGDILLKADKMSMANSLELRVPFLDKEVFAVARQIPTKYKVNENETKIALRKAALPHVGEKNANRRKLGFPVPIRDWLRKEPYVSKVEACFESAAAEQFFDTRELKKLLRNHVSGKKDNWREIWCVYMFLVWYRVYFEEE